MTRDTSIEAYQKIKADGLLSRRRWEVYSVLYRNGPLTATLIASLMPGEKSASVGANVHARLCELREMGVVKEVGEVQCPVSKMRVISWDVTSALPKKLEKKAERWKWTVCKTHFVIIGSKDGLKSGCGQQTESLFPCEVVEVVETGKVRIVISRQPLSEAAQ